MATQSPVRGAKHDALHVFLGKWSAHGTSYGGTDQSGEDAKANGECWMSTHEAAWHTGSFFLVQDERAIIAGSRFDTLSVMGIDLDTGEYFARAFENHGFYRNYKVTRQDNVWNLIGETERAKIEFADGDRTQIITWELKADGEWLPLCDRTAVRAE
jgi:hypothetical protein